MSGHATRRPGSFPYNGVVNGAYYRVNQASEL
jgi:hypothetical protein